MNNQKTLICQICGKEVIKRKGTQKFCEQCSAATAAERYRAAKQRYHERSSVSVSSDTEEMVKCCLSCKRKRCSGECQQLAKLVRGSDKQ